MHFVQDLQHPFHRQQIYCSSRCTCCKWCNSIGVWFELAKFTRSVRRDVRLAVDDCGLVRIFQHALARSKWGLSSGCRLANLAEGGTLDNGACGGPVRFCALLLLRNCIESRCCG